MPTSPTRGAVLHRLGLDYKVDWDGFTFEVWPSFVDNTRGYKLRQHLWEQPEYTAGVRYFQRDVPIYEFGGGLGVTAVRWNAELNPPRHIVVEPNPHSVRLCERQARLNDSSFVVESAALGYSGGELTIDTLGKIKTGRSAQEQTAMTGVSVPVQPLEHWVKEKCNVALDVEGAEVDVLKHSMPTLQRYAMCLVVDWTERVLSGEHIRAMIRDLEDSGFHWVSQQGNVSCFVNGFRGFDA